MIYWNNISVRYPNNTLCENNGERRGWSRTSPADRFHSRQSVRDSSVRTIFGFGNLVDAATFQNSCYTDKYLFDTRLWGEMAHWLEREFPDQKVCDSNPTSASRLPLSRLGQPDSISALVLLSGGMAAGHRKGVAVERLHTFVPTMSPPVLSRQCTLVSAATVSITEKRGSGTCNQALEGKACLVHTLELGLA
ncbi:hypothetical protein T265_01302 [Opisthorchis viverrini]|uniref:Uncharacterized protein n=1 Tax=Opisthorchis viverrini TaxID=6198 RepID=A0A074ZYT0_OPIVI|nr:hypothetical protein T265_01302 [Opisthorchis viverrini]KER32613.1 hypothetical protein T265_01302 [Opisthorchis viverrini]